MAIQQITATICGKNYPLAYNSQTGLYEFKGTAPEGSSFPLAGGYYPVELKARTDLGEHAEANDQTPGLGESLRLVVREGVSPTASFTRPADGAILETSRPAVTAHLRDSNSGINPASLSFFFDSKEILPGSPGLTLAPAAGGFDLTYVPPARLDSGRYSAVLSVADNDGNRCANQTRSFTIYLPGRLEHTDALCAHALPGWKAQTIEPYQIHLFGPNYRAVLIRRCHCV